jgi:hypothetical protein
VLCFRVLLFRHSLLCVYVFVRAEKANRAKQHKARAVAEIIKNHER